MSISASTIGDAWIAIAQRIMELGVPGSYDGLAMREVLMVTLSWAPADDRRHRRPLRRPGAPGVDEGELRRLPRVPELGDASSYATRLHDYAGTGLDQLTWVSERLRRDPLSRSATITTFQPLSDTSYIPCVSLLDFYLDEDALALVVYAHSIDFGAKGYANLLELAVIQHQVASELDRAVGSLTMIVKSAHVYDGDAAYMTSVLENFA